VNADEPLFPSHDDIQRQLAAARRRRSEALGDLIARLPIALRAALGRLPRSFWLPRPQPRALMLRRTARGASEPV